MGKGLGRRRAALTGGQEPEEAEEPEDQRPRHRLPLRARLQCGATGTARSRPYKGAGRARAHRPAPAHAQWQGLGAGSVRGVQNGGRGFVVRVAGRGSPDPRAAPPPLQTARNKAYEAIFASLRQWESQRQEFPPQTS